MKFTLSWLKEFLHTDASVEHISRTLTAIGLEVEAVEDRGAELAAFTVAEILSAEKHPDADKLKICQVKTHSDTRQIVCGAPNARAGIKVALADIGAIIPNGGFEIKKSKIRGVESNGMLCSARELNLGEDHAGIMELPVSAPVGQSIVEVLGLNDVLFEIAITPNRGDCLGVYGVARDLAAAGIGTLRSLPLHAEGDLEGGGTHAQLALADEKGTPTSMGKGTPTQPSPASSGGLMDAGRGIRLETPDCPMFVGRLIAGVKNGPSPEWLQQRLKSVGLRPISALVDITNYFTIAYGRPLHVFDADTLKGDIRARASVAGETLEALNDKSYTLPEGLCVIADDSGVLGLGGVVGGTPSGCTEATTNVFLECAWFEPDAIARSGRALQVDSDARYRFERTVDPQFLLPAAELATRMIVDLCGGTPSARVIAGEPPALNQPITFETTDVLKLGGLDVPVAECERILSTLGCRIEKTRVHQWTVTPPSWRPDLTMTADLVEEVLRIYGYDHLPETALPAATAEGGEHFHAWQDVRRLMAARGLRECHHFAFVTPMQAEQFRQVDEAQRVTILNPISAEEDTMRPSLLPGLMEAAKRNLGRAQEHLALGEVGVVFHGLAPEDQPMQAAGLRLGATADKDWSRTGRSTDVFDVKADLMAVLESMGVDTRNVQLATDGLPAYYHPGKSGCLRLGPKQVLGWFGALHPRINRAWDIEPELFAFEALLANIPARKKKERQALKLSEYQRSRRDFAFVVDAELPAAELLKAVSGADRQLVRDIALFDVYQGKGVPEGKKSMAISVSLQADDRTLTEADLTRVSDAIVQAAGRKGATLR
jgi:phenylalanyl-tRNA synthetase beta chain